MINEPKKIFDAVALSSTNTVKSLVMPTASHNVFAQGKFTSTAAGVLSIEHNYLLRGAYNVACGVAANETPTPAQEAANTTGWITVPYFYPISGVQSTTGTIAIAAADSFSVRIKKGPLRARLSYTNASGSGAVTATQNANEVL